MRCKKMQILKPKSSLSYLVDSDFEYDWLFLSASSADLDFPDFDFPDFDILDFDFPDW